MHIENLHPTATARFIDQYRLLSLTPQTRPCVQHPWRFRYSNRIQHRRLAITECWSIKHGDRGPEIDTRTSQ